MDLKDKYDAIVIGSGPAGSSFSRECAKAGMDVLVLEKKKDIGSPVRCGEGLSGHWENDIGFKIPESAIAARINGIFVEGPNKKRITIRPPASKGVVLERKIFDKHLAFEAGRHGAHILCKTIVTSVIKENNKPAGVKAVHLGEEFEARADLIVSAEGMEARIGREMGFPALATLYDSDSCCEYEMVNVPCEDLIEVYIGNKLAPRGYVWIFPKGKDVANVGIGIGAATGGNPKKLLDDFLASDERYKNAEIIEVKVGVISVGAPLEKLAKDNCMIIGTAAHQVDPIHGGGIGLAIEAGEIAAKVAAKAFEKKDYSENVLKEYETVWSQAARGKLLTRLKLRKVFEKLSDNDLNFLFSEITSGDFDDILAGKYEGFVSRLLKSTKVLARRPQLLKILPALI